MTATHRCWIGCFLLLCFVAPIAFGEASPDGPVGWRGDWSGVFADASPVTEWSESKNVRWKTPMPQWSNGSPIVVAERVFVTAEPHTLICLDAGTGAVLWSKENDHLDLLPPEEAARVKAAWEAEWEFERQRNALLYELNELKQWAKDAPDDENAQRELAAFREKLAGLELNLDDTRGGYAGDSPLRREQEKRRSELEKLYGLYFETWLRWDYWIGNSMPTPVSDGQHVWAHFGNNAVVCYTLDGQRQWMKWLSRGFDKKSKEAGDPYWGGYPRALFVASPVLVDGTLVVQSGRAIRGIDPATGDVRWEEEIDRYFEYSVGSPVPMQVGQISVIITAFGDVRRVADGKLLASNVGFSPNGASPTVHGDVVYFENGANPGGIVPNVRHTIEAVRLIPDGPDAVKAEVIWSDESAGGYISPIYHDGLLYHVDQQHLTVRDAATGEIFDDSARIEDDYSQLTLAGKYLVVSDSRGHFTVWTAGKQTTLVAKNELKVDEPVGEKLEQRKRASGEMHWQFMFGLPFFAGDRMYVRSYDNLYCVGPTR